MLLWHPHILHYDIDDKKDLYVHSAIRTLWTELLWTFLPVMLYHELWLGLSSIFLFFGIRSVWIVLGVYFLAAWFVSEYGTKMAMIVGIPLLIAMFLWIQMLPWHPWLLVVIPLLWSLFTSFFRMGFHTDMAQYAWSQAFWTKVALLSILVTITSAITPTLWGVLLDTYPLQVTLLTWSTLLFFSLVPLFHTAKYHTPVSFSQKKMLDMSFQGAWLQAIATFAGQTYVRFVGMVIWPLIIFIFLWSYTKLWIITSITTLIVVVVLYVSGKYADNHQEAKVMRRNVWVQTGNWLTALWLFSSTLLSSMTIWLIDVFNRLTMHVSSTMISKAMYEFANDTKANPVYITAMHEMGNHVCRASICLVFAALFFFLGDNPAYLTIPLLLLLLFIPLQLLIFKRW